MFPFACRLLTGQALTVEVVAYIGVEKVWYVSNALLVCSLLADVACSNTTACARWRLEAFDAKMADFTQSRRPTPAEPFPAQPRSTYSVSKLIVFKSTV